MFFSELAPFVQKLPHGFVVDYWNNTAKTAAGKNTVQSLGKSAPNDN